ncbi:MAG TPA: asparagine synthase C-terminal domain-containing protein, partial [Bacteroidota bacterium]|nr:asparagine synthase C-terminal domain-containing protein [Bacteroidota bacterium]
INFTETHKRSLISTGRRRTPQMASGAVRQWHEEILRKDPGADYLKRMIYLEFKNRLPELLLMRVDKMAMATSVEARVPFLDHRMVEFSMQIPMLLKTRNGEPKYIMKKAVEDIIPRNIVYRKKQGFAAPVNEWLRNEWYGFLESKLLHSHFVTSGYFNRDVVLGMLADHRNRRRNEGQNLWNLLNLVLWHEQWIEGRSVA